MSLSNKVSFDELPDDIIFSICHELENYHETKKSHLLSAPKGKIVNGRRIIDDSNHQDSSSHPHPLIALSSLNKRKRVLLEPLLFRQIVFGQKWEAHAAERWSIAKTRMKAMLQKGILRRTVRVFKIECKDSPQDAIGQSSFWSLLATVLIHFSSLETVVLGFWAQEYPKALRDALTETTTTHSYPPPSQHSEITHLGQNQESNKWSNLLTGCVSSIPDPVAIGQGSVHDDNRGRGTSTVVNFKPFFSIKHAHLYRNCHWFTYHCPNLETFVDLGDSPPKNIKIPVGTLISSCKRLRVLKIRLVADVASIIVLLRVLPDLEILSMVVPFISQASDGWELRVLVEYFCQFRRLQNLELQRTAIKPVFPHRGQELRNILSSVVLDYGKQCKMLTSFKLGGFTFTRDNLERDLVMERYNPTDATMPIPNI